MNTKAKYVVLPGFVRSKNDGQLHAVGAATLMKLYKLTASITENVQRAVRA